MTAIGNYEILFHSAYLDWLFDDPAMEAAFRANEDWKGAMPAGVMVDRKATTTSPCRAGRRAFRQR